MDWKQKVERGQVVLLDGGTGSELQRRGVPMNESAWSGLAVHTHPGVVREVHEAYIAAGAEVIITNTFGTTRYLLEAAGLGDEFENINRKAVQIAVAAREASGRDIAIAGSISNLPPSMQVVNYPLDDAELASLRELGAILADAGVDIIALEMMQDRRHGGWAMEAALATGLPVWLGVSCRRRPDGAGLVSFDLPDIDFATPLDALIAMGPDAVNIMHSEMDAVAPAIAMVRERWQGPLGVYPEVGEFKPPDWTFDPEATPERFVGQAREWVDSGALLIGGCCGTTPEHIAALHADLSSASGADGPGARSTRP